MVEGVILAAGASRRAQSNKLLWSHKGKSLLEHAIAGMRPFVSRIYVVTGFYHEEIVAHLAGVSDVVCVNNVSHHHGMFSSVQTGVARVEGDFLILPADCPFIKPETYLALLKGTHVARVPVYKQRKGHPLYMHKSLKNSLLKESELSNLKAFRDRYTVECMDVDDPGILNDIDTLEDFKDLTMKTRKD